MLEGKMKRVRNLQELQTCLHSVAVPGVLTAPLAETWEKGSRSYCDGGSMLEEARFLARTSAQACLRLAGTGRVAT